MIGLVPYPLGAYATSPEGGGGLTVTVSATLSGSAGYPNDTDALWLAVSSTASGVAAAGGGGSLTVGVASFSEGTVIRLADCVLTVGLGSGQTVTQLKSLKFSTPVLEMEYDRRIGNAWWVGGSKGLSVWLKDGVWHAREYPQNYETDGATYLFRGGRTYEITSAESNALTAAGFGSGIFYE